MLRTNLVVIEILSFRPKNITYLGKKLNMVMNFNISYVKNV